MNYFPLLKILSEESKRFHVGDRVGWDSEGGNSEGTIKAVHTKEFLVNGYTHHATPDDPQYEIKSNKSDHVAYHKASALHHLG